VKYGTWSVAEFDPKATAALEAVGFSPLTAAVLSSRGYESPQKAWDFLQAESSLTDPFLLKDMEKAVARIQRAIKDGEKIAVYGDYDVDGITATCLLTEFLQEMGAACQLYIPHRTEDGYGLNCPAITTLAQEGVKLIITVDCGITATEETLHAKNLGMDMIITDHHACKDTLPDAVAVVNPQRKDCDYPFKELAGVGVAMKLVLALTPLENRREVLLTYADLVAVGTIADVMRLLGENRCPA